MFAYKAHIGENGRIVIPAKIRKAANLSVGQSVVISIENSAVKISAYSDKLKNIQNIVQEYSKNNGSLVDKLSEIRQEEQRNE